MRRHSEWTNSHTANSEGVRYPKTLQPFGGGVNKRQAGVGREITVLEHKLLRQASQHYYGWVLSWQKKRKF
jgi:hypothetical protein